jgi:dephospho-CoA kinase
MRIVVTGNVGCGKSTVVAYLKERLSGYVHFDFDVELRALYEQPYFKEQLTKLLGTSDRKSISAMVFADPALKAKLEFRTAPLLESLVRNRLAQDYSSQVGVFLKRTSWWQWCAVKSSNALV